MEKTSNLNLREKILRIATLPILLLLFLVSLGGFMFAISSKQSSVKKEDDVKAVNITVYASSNGYLRWNGNGFSVGSSYTFGDEGSYDEDEDWYWFEYRTYWTDGDCIIFRYWDPVEEYNIDYTLQATGNSGYHFSYWSGTTAYFAADITTSSITYSLNGGTNNSANPTSYTNQSGLIVPLNPTKTGYTFAGWNDSTYFNLGLSYTTSSPATFGQRDWYQGNSFSVTSGTTYRVLVTAKRTAGSLNINGGIWYTEQSSGDPWDSVGGSFTKIQDLSNGWGRYYKDVTVPSGKTKGQFYIQIDQDHSGGSTTWQLADCAVVANYSTASIPTGSTGTKTFTAKWTANTYYVKYNGNGNTGGSMSNSTHTYGTAKNLTANGFTKTGYYFTGWATSSTGMIVYDDKQSVSNLTATNGGTFNLYAKWANSNYTVAYNGNGATGGSTASSSHTYGTAKNLTANGFTKTGYSFAGWATSASGNVVYSNQQSVSNLATTNGATVTLYAKWTINTYTVTVDPNGGTFNSTTSTTNYSQNYGTTKTIGDPTRTGYTFGGWVATKTAYDATWIEILYHDNKSGSVLFTSNDNLATNTINTQEKLALFNQLQYLKKDGKYEFLLEYNHVSGYNRWTQTLNPATNTSTGDYYSLNLAWGSNSWAGIAKSSSSTSTFIDGSPNAGTWFYALGAYEKWNDGIPGPSSAEKNVVRLWVRANSNLSNFTGTSIIKDADALGNNNTYYFRDENITLKAIWIANTYTITLDREGGTTGSTSVTATYNSATLSSFDNPTKTGYTFGGYWTGDNGTGTLVIATNKTLQANVSGYTGAGGIWTKTTTPTTLYAKWTAKTYTITLDKQNGSGGTNSVTATYGSAMPTITVPTREGYAFQGYYYGTGCSGKQYYTKYGYSSNNWNVDENRTLYAGWVKLYTLTVMPDNWDCADFFCSYDALVSREDNQNVVMTVEENWVFYVNNNVLCVAGTYNTIPYVKENWSDAYDAEFNNWTYNGNVVTLDFNYIHSDVTIVGNYTRTGKQFEVSFNVNNGGGSGYQTANVTATYGSAMPSISTTAPTRAGYKFMGWYDNATYTSGTQYYTAAGASARTWNKTSNTTLYAGWKANTYTVAYAGMSGANYGTNHPTSATFDTAFTVNNPSKTGYTFAGWNITGMDSVTHTYGSSTTTATSLSGRKETSFKNLRSTSGTVTFTATWTANTQTLTVDLNGGESYKNIISVDSYNTTTVSASGGTAFYSELSGIVSLMSSSSDNYGITEINFSATAGTRYIIHAKFWNALNSDIGYNTDIAQIFYGNNKSFNETESIWNNFSSFTFADSNTFVATNNKMFGEYGTIKTNSTGTYYLRFDNDYAENNNILNIGEIWISELTKVTGTYTQSIKSDQYYQLATPTREGYTFAGWEVVSGTLGSKTLANVNTSSCVLSRSHLQMGTGNVTIRATWTAKAESASYLRSDWFGIVGMYDNLDTWYPNLVILDEHMNVTTNTNLTGFEFVSTKPTGANIYLIGSVGATDESSTTYCNDFSSCYDVTAYWNSSNGRVIIYSPVTIYAPADCSNMFSITGFTAFNLRTEYRLRFNINTVPLYSSGNIRISLNLSNFNTAKVTDMNHMFMGCSSLSSIDLSSFNTANVTNMSSMFNGCASLTSLDLSSFNTSNVTNMSYMFATCSALNGTVGTSGTAISLGSNFNTAKVTNMSHMFDGCTRLTSINLSSFNSGSSNTSKVDQMDYMFNECTSLTSVNLNNWSSNSSSGEAYTEGMFKRCIALTSLDLSSWSIGDSIEVDLTDFLNMASDDSEVGTGYMGALTSVTFPTTTTGGNAIKCYSMYDAFVGLHYLTEIDLSMFDMQNKKGKTTDYKYSCLDACDSLLVIKTPQNMNNSGNYGKFRLPYIYVDNDGVMEAAFYEDSSDYTKLATGFVMEGNPNPNNYIVIHQYTYYIETDRSTAIEEITSSPSSSLTIRAGWIVTLDKQNGTGGDNSTTALYGLTMAAVTAPTRTGYTFGGYYTGTNGSGDKYYNANGTSANSWTQTVVSPTLYAKWIAKTAYLYNDIGNQLNNFVIYLVNSIDGLTEDKIVSITFSSSSTMPNLPSVSVGATDASGSTLDANASVRAYYSVDGSGNYTFTIAALEGATIYAPTNSACLFYNLTNLSTLNLTNFDTTNTTNMSLMFMSCESLASLDLSSIDTSNVTNMSAMFNGCASLTSLDLSTFNTAKVTNMSSMFKGCSGLTGTVGTNGTAIKLGNNFSTANVTDMSEMFTNCTNLTNINLSTFNTAKVTNMSSMFNGCQSLTSLDLSTFNTAKVENMNSMFGACSGLTGTVGTNGTAIKLGNNFSTANVANFKGMFNDCSSLTELDLHTFDLSSTMDDEGDYSNYKLTISRCSGLKTIITPINNPTSLGFNHGAIGISNFYDADVAAENRVVKKNHNTTSSKTYKAGFIVTANGNDGTITSANGWTAGNPATTATRVVLWDENIADAYPTIAKVGHTLSKWTLTNSANADAISATYKPTAATNIYAQWTVNRYQVTLNHNNGTNNTTVGWATYGTVENLYDAAIGGDQFRVASPTKTGYSFQGWYDGTGNDAKKVLNTDGQTWVANSAYTNADRQWISTAANTNLYAKWTPNTNTAYTVEHYQQQLNGTYTKVDTQNLTGTTDTTATAVAQSYTGFVENTTHASRVASGNIAGDGSLVLRLYYNRLTYTITWKNDDNTTLEIDNNVMYGATPTYNGETPTKVQTAQYTYTFSGWSPTISAVTGAQDYTAQFNSTLRSYTIRFLNGEDVLQSSSVNYGVTPTYSGATPTRPNDSTYSYEFTGWDPTIYAVDKDQDYIAQYDATLLAVGVITIQGNYASGCESTAMGFVAIENATTHRVWTIMLVDNNVYELSKLENGTYNIRVEASINHNAVAKMNSSTITSVTFASNDEIHTRAITVDISPKATIGGGFYNEYHTTNVMPTYAIRFLNYDGTVLQSNNLEYGAMPEYTGATPTKTREGYICEFNGWSPTISAVTGAQDYTATFTETEDTVDYITFSSPSEFSLATTNSSPLWDGTILYSYDGTTWDDGNGNDNVWDGTKLTASNGILYLKGYGNSRITKVGNTINWVLEGSNISCSGDIEYLRGKGTNNYPAMAVGCYQFMFNGCTNLTTAPTLSATTLTASCYQYMFKDCTSLTTAPEMQATTLAQFCCRAMFQNCTSLETLPALPATTLAKGCCASMFSGCTKIKLSETKHDEYQYAYRVPYTGNGTIVNNDLNYMFDATGGTFTGTPTINAIYYTSNEVIRPEGVSELVVEQNAGKQKAEVVLDDNGVVINSNNQAVENNSLENTEKQTAKNNSLASANNQIVYVLENMDIQTASNQAVENVVLENGQSNTDQWLTSSIKQPYSSQNKQYFVG